MADVHTPDAGATEPEEVEWREVARDVLEVWPGTLLGRRLVSGAGAVRVVRVVRVENVEVRELEKAQVRERVEQKREVDAVDEPA